MMKTCKILLTSLLVLVSSLGFSQSVPSYVPTSGLVGWWGFNGNAQDGSGNGNHGTVNGATLTTDRFGNQNGAYLSNSISTNSITGSCSNFPSGNSPRTISIWYNATGLGSGCCKGLFGYGGGGCGNSLIMNLDHGGDGIGKFEIQGHCQAFRRQVDYPLPANNFWHNVLISYDANEILRFYFNGQLSYTSAPVSLNTNVSGKIFNLIGEVWPDGNSPYIDGPWTPFNGKLDDIGIWNRALTQQEITNLYYSQLPTQASLCLPTITTTSPSSVGVDSVVIGGNITNDGGSSIVLRGVCYSTSPNPNMGNQKTQDGSGIGSFNTVLRGLSSSTTYYARSYAKNSNGVVAYGPEVSFTTSATAPSFTCGTSTVSDMDNNTYTTVQIGTQCWTQSNLKVSKYRNGDNIPTGLNNSQWSSTTSGAYAIYNNDPVNDGLYGKLYNHYAVTDSRGLCPTGWHVPSDAEWTTLENQLGGSSVAGGALKSTAIEPTPGGWRNPNIGATNSSGFTALPGGLRRDDGSFDIITNYGQWWSSSVSSGSNAWYRLLTNSLSDFYRLNFNLTHGLSVRCLKNTLPQVNTTSVTNVTPSTAMVTGEVISEGDQNTTRGFSYSTTSNPTVSNDTTMNGTGLGVYSDTLLNLAPSTTYYARAYATNSVGTLYGNELNFSTTAAPSFTCGTSTVSDVDNNTYNTVQIGTQCWTQSNLKVSKYRNGDNITTGLSNSDWLVAVSGAFSSINNDTGNDSTYGSLYNHFATIDVRGLCPTGWSVPNDDDWNILLDYVWTICGCGSFYASPLRSSNLWLQNTNGSNVTNFNATPNGMKTNWGVFNGFGSQATFWSSSLFNSTQTGPVILSNNNAISRALLSRNSGLGVRCIKD